MNSQQPQYEQFLQASHAILEKCDPESDGAKEINKKLDEINKSWDKVQGRLDEREATLKEALQLSTKFYEVLQALSEWLPTVTEQLDKLPPVSTQIDGVAEQKEELKKISDDVEAHKPKIEEAATLCKQLCDSTKEQSTKFDLRNKLSSVEKPYNDASKKRGKSQFLPIYIYAGLIPFPMSSYSFKKKAYTSEFALYSWAHICISHNVKIQWVLLNG